MVVRVGSVGEAGSEAEETEAGREEDQQGVARRVVAVPVAGVEAVTVVAALVAPAVGVVLGVGGKEALLALPGSSLDTEYNLGRRPFGSSPAYQLGAIAGR